MGWNDENDWFVGPEFESWQYDLMPAVLPKTQNVIKQVRAIFPKAVVFRDNHEYCNRTFETKIYSVGECENITCDEPVVITGDYQKSRSKFRNKGKWCVSIDEAWQSAWESIQKSLLDKFEK